VANRADHNGLAGAERFSRRSIRAMEAFMAELVMTARRRRRAAGRSIAT
jgi:hypothetical protein